MNTVSAAQNTTSIPKVIQVDCRLCGAKPMSNNTGKPNTMAASVWSTRLFAAGVSNLGSISRNRIIPLDAVPVNIPNMEKKPSY